MVRFSCTRVVNRCLYSCHQRLKWRTTIAGRGIVVCLGRLLVRCSLLISTSAQPIAQHFGPYGLIWLQATKKEKQIYNDKAFFLQSFRNIPIHSKYIETNTYPHTYVFYIYLHVHLYIMHTYVCIPMCMIVIT